MEMPRFVRQLRLRAVRRKTLREAGICEQCGHAAALPEERVCEGCLLLNMSAP